MHRKCRCHHHHRHRSGELYRRYDGGGEHEIYAKHEGDGDIEINLEPRIDLNNQTITTNDISTAEKTPTASSVITQATATSP